MASSDSTLVKHSPHKTMVEGSGPATAAVPRRQNGKKVGSLGQQQ
jgi:hypothetical protein